MSTRSLIARQTKNGIEAIYCHHDGCPEDKSPILTGHYNTGEKVAKLIALGDLSELGPRLGKKHDFETHGKEASTKNWCLAYGRDRNDKDTARRKYSSESEFLDDAHRRWAAFVYIFRDGRWLWRQICGDQEWTEC